MDFSLELGKEVLRGTPDVLRALLSDSWTSGSLATQDPIRGLPIKSFDT
jgi:hypothetical protein